MNKQKSIVTLIFATSCLINLAVITGIETFFNTQNNILSASASETVATNSQLSSVELSVSHLKAMEMVKEFEGFRSQAYIDSDGTPVIGYGMSMINGRTVQMGDYIAQVDAESALSIKLREIQQQISSTTLVKLNSNQLAALTSFAFNVGFESLERSSLLRKLNSGDYLSAANEFPRWNKADMRGQLVPLSGLSKRRQAERAVFLTSY
ncbi:MAG: lysozyme [Cyanobacteria bacterium P01_G01_bin.39]